MMRHEITHRFNPTFKVSFSCQLCDRPMFYGVKCKYCKYLCHKNCAARAPPSCGLPEEFVDMFAQTITTSNNTSASGDENSWGTRQNSVTAQEWEIPYSDLTIPEEIQSGEFGQYKVHKGYWHGDVAIKELIMPTGASEKSLEMVKELFRDEVANFRNTRHDNLEIFMGACMVPDNSRQAIVTTYCNGQTLHDQLHLHKTKFHLARIIDIAQQICLGMGYLHSRNIVHKDLKSKNIFYNNNQVVITDFGLFSLKRLCRTERTGPWLPIPKNWLSYLAPELMRKLNPHYGPECNNLNFTFATDVYSFGTIWYELLTGDMPYSNPYPEITIWQVGRGLKQPLINLQASREVKNLLMMCWSAERPKFPDISNLLQSLPKKRVQRSSSFQQNGSKF